MEAKKLNIVFMGTTIFSAEILDFLYNKGVSFNSIVTIPDKPKGRGLKVAESHVKRYATKHDLPILQPERLDDPDFIKQLQILNPDLIVVVAFKKIPKEIYRLPRLGAINLHASYLPQYRGAAPINWAIINGETETGITTFSIDEQIDTGSILLQEKVEIRNNETAGSLHDKLLEKGKSLLLKTIEGLANNTIQSIKQNNSLELKPAPKLTKDVCKIDFNDTTQNVYNKIRGLTPYPGAWAMLQTKEKNYQIKLFEVEPSDHLNPKESGAITIDHSNLMVSTLDGHVLIKELQLEGKKRVSGTDFINGFRNLETCKF